jgi:hypothetical protein
MLNRARLALVAAFAEMYPLRRTQGSKWGEVLTQMEQSIEEIGKELGNKDAFGEGEYE